MVYSIRLLARSPQSQLPAKSLLKQRPHFNKTCRHSKLQGHGARTQRLWSFTISYQTLSAWKARLHWTSQLLHLAPADLLCPSMWTAELTSTNGAMPIAISSKWEADGGFEGPSGSIVMRWSLPLWSLQLMRSYKDHDINLQDGWQERAGVTYSDLKIDVVFLEKVKGIIKNSLEMHIIKQTLCVALKIHICTKLIT